MSIIARPPFWNPDIWEMRPEAAPYVKLLYDAGVLFSSPEEAAHQVRSVLPHADDWWSEEAIQEARRKFVARFAYTESGWLDHWVKELD